MNNRKTEQTKLVIRSIFSFILLYFLSFVTGGGILLFSVWLLCASDIRTKYNLPDISIAVLLCGSAFLLFQMIRSLCQSYKADTKSMRELSREEMPELFEMINEVATFMKTDAPRKVFLSPSVTASVFLNTSSTLFFSPEKKRLEVGAGLINILTMEELKAVIAHEMGHFSQRSMFLNGYVYSIEQMVDFMSKQADFKKKGHLEQQIKGLFNIFHIITLLIFHKLNRRFKDFSLELEYDADRLAVECVGVAPLKSALLKVSFASAIYKDTVTILGNWAIHGKRVSDIYTAHRYTIDVYLSVFCDGEQFTENLWTKLHILLSPAIRCRLARFASSTPTENGIGRLAREYIPTFRSFSTLFTKFTYTKIYRKDYESLEECRLFTYRKWITEYYLWLSDRKREVKVITLRIDLPAKLHRLPLVDVKLEIHIDKKQIGEGSFKKGIALSVPVTPGKHLFSITCWSECCMNETIAIEENDLQKILDIDYKVELWKGRYNFFVLDDR